MQPRRSKKENVGKYLISITETYSCNLKCDRSRKIDPRSERKGMNFKRNEGQILLKTQGRA